MKFDRAQDFVQMRNGSSFVGVVTQKTFSVELAVAAKPMKIATDKILHIVFSNKYGYAADELRFKDGSSLQGKVLDAKIKFRSDALGDLEIPTKNILAIQLLGNL